jgi:hypothetical protein
MKWLIRYLRLKEASVSVASPVVNLTVKEMYQLSSRGSASCVSYRDTIIFPEQAWKRTHSAARDPLPPNTHTTQRRRFRQFRRPNIPEMLDISQICFLFLVVTLMCKLTSCSNHFAFFDLIGFFLHETIFSKIHYKQEIFYDEFPLTYSENFLRPNTSYEIIIRFIFKKWKNRMKIYNKTIIV